MDRSLTKKRQMKDNFVIFMKADESFFLSPSYVSAALSVGFIFRQLSLRCSKHLQLVFRAQNLRDSSDSTNLFLNFFPSDLKAISFFQLFMGKNSAVFDLV